MKSIWRPRRTARSRQSVANCPVSTISTVSPGDKVFTNAASHAPVPEHGVHDDGAGGLEHALETPERLAPEFGKRRTAMIDRRLRDRAQDAIGHVGGAGDLKKMASALHTPQ